MADVLLIGYGNPLRGDDGIGWVVAEKMAERNPSIKVITDHQLLPEYAEPISEAKLVIFVDVADGTEAGIIKRESIVPIPPQPGAFTHHLTPSGLLSMAQDVFDRSPPAYLFTITGTDFEFSEEISPLLQQKMSKMLEKIEEVINTFE
jgi:hydrogenase maturation protease